MRVLVTRPAHQADTLIGLIEAAGGEALRLPTIEIVAPLDPRIANALFDRLPEFDLAIFLSPNAVRMALPALRTRGIPASLRFAAVGMGTRQTLQTGGVDQVLAPTQRFDSEALLELLPGSEVMGKKILLIKGAGGRELLSTELSRRGAQVSHAECYRRVPPAQPDPAVLARLCAGDVDILSITSVEGMQNLYALVSPGGRAQLLAKPVLVINRRQAEACHALGFEHTVVAERASDVGLLEGLCAWRTKQR